MSTAQRLRTASPSGQGSSRSSTPTQVFKDTTLASRERSYNSTQEDHHASGRQTAYRPGFQPKGTYRVRTDEFEAARSRKRTTSAGYVDGDEKPSVGSTRFELESERLERRLEKLLAIHYDEAPLLTEEEAVALAPTWLPNTLRKARLQAEADRRVREEEMRIVKWEDDKKRRACSICSTPFSLSVRKHHCRLCGRLVCASPHLAMPPIGVGSESAGFKESRGANVADAKCSTLMISDGDDGTAKIKEVPRWDEVIGGAGVDQEGRTRGMRICRDCKDTILHRQYMLDDGSVPPYVKLYEALVLLQKEIEQSLPEFQEMIMGLQKHDAAAALGTANEDDSRDPLLAPNAPARDQSTLQAMKAKNRTALALQRDAAQARKQLLANFANYDSIAKKIRSLDDEGNASLARIKMAIYARASVFLQTYMFPLQNLPKLTSAPSAASMAHSSPTIRSGQSSPVRRGTPTRGSVTQAASESNAGATQAQTQSQKEIRDSLVVLEQQLVLVRQYAASASKSRKLQDASSLNASARDLEREIERVRRTLQD